MDVFCALQLVLRVGDCCTCSRLLMYFSSFLSLMLKNQQQIFMFLNCKLQLIWMKFRKFSFSSFSVEHLFTQLKFLLSLMISVVGPIRNSFMVISFTFSLQHCSFFSYHSSHSSTHPLWTLSEYPRCFFHRHTMHIHKDISTHVHTTHTVELPS